MILASSLLLYIATVIFGVMYTKNKTKEEMQKTLTKKQMALAMTWFVFFIKTQMLWIHEIMMMVMGE